MLRKQVYLAREHDRKIKALAARRGCTEAEIIREAVERLPNPEDEWTERMRAEGIFAPKPDFPDRAHLPRGDAHDLDRTAFESWLDAEPLDLRLSEAVEQDRGPR